MGGETLTAEETTRIRRALLAKRLRLLGRWKNEGEEEGELLAEREPDWEDLAAEQRDAAVFDRLSDAEVHELEEIVAALRRIDEGTYGRCENCGNPIQLDRLRALPEMRLCVACATEAEQGPPFPPSRS